jgi:Ras-related protein Rab-1A
LQSLSHEEPPVLPIGTDVSAKYKGAFCEAKIKKISRNVKCKLTLKQGNGSLTVDDELINGVLRVGSHVSVKNPDKSSQSQEAVINKILDQSFYTVVFDDGDEATLKRNSLCLKSGKHFAESETLDQLPLTNPEHFGNPVSLGNNWFLINYLI